MAKESRAQRIEQKIDELQQEIKDIRCNHLATLYDAVKQVTTKIEMMGKLQWWIMGIVGLILVTLIVRFIIGE